jgi:hypothetical protein
VPQIHNGRQLKYARTVANTPSSVWAWWRPDIVASGHYDISVWVPGQHATTRMAQYQLHGVVGENQPLIVYVNQNRFSDTWVSLGVYELDANNPASGQVNLTNYTGEEKRSVAFSDVRWRPVDLPVAGEQRTAGRWLRRAGGHTRRSVGALRSGRESGSTRTPLAIITGCATATIIIRARPQSEPAAVGQRPRQAGLLDAPAAP